MKKPWKTAASVMMAAIILLPASAGAEEGPPVNVLSKESFAAQSYEGKVTAIKLYFETEKLNHEKLMHLADGITASSMINGMQAIVGSESFKNRYVAKELEEMIDEYAGDPSKHEELISLVSRMQETMKATQGLSGLIAEKARFKSLNGEDAFARVSERLKEDSPRAYRRQLIHLNERRSGDVTLVREIASMMTPEEQGRAFFYNHSLKSGFETRDEDGDFLLTLDEFSENKIAFTAIEEGRAVFRGNERTLRIGEDGVTLNDVQIGNPDLSTDTENGTRYRMAGILSLLGYSVDEIEGMTYITKPKTETPALLNLSAEEIVKAAFAKTKGE